VELFSSGRSAFRVGFKDTSGETHRIFVATNEHARKHWMDCIKQVMPLQENKKTKCSSPSEAKKKIKSVVPRKCMDKSSWNKNDSQFIHPFRQQNRISKSITKDNLV
jgi:hypothetical protein